MQSPQQRQKTPDKLFYKIGEVSDIAKVEPYVLRYWESEFQFLTPRKNKSGQRVYTRKNVELILQIKKLLYQEKYTIAGVKKKFSGASGEKGSVSRETIEGIRKKLKAMRLTIPKLKAIQKPANRKTKKSTMTTRSNPVTSNGYLLIQKPPLHPASALKLSKLSGR